MNKWIYSSISLNIYALFSFLSIFWTWHPFWNVMTDKSTGAGGIVGFVFVPISFICVSILIGFYLLELIIYAIFKKYSFSFPYSKIKYKIPYYIFFYTGILWTTWLGMLCYCSIMLDVCSAIYHFFQKLFLYTL